MLVRCPQYSKKGGHRAGGIDRPDHAPGRMMRLPAGCSGKYPVEVVIPDGVRVRQHTAVFQLLLHHRCALTGCALTQAGELFDVEFNPKAFRERGNTRVHPSTARTRERQPYHDSSGAVHAAQKDIARDGHGVASPIRLEGRRLELSPTFGLSAFFANRAI
eukprot:SAG31_NODE_1973_length_6757_cov_1.653950_3_plen_161_part_00